MLKNLIDKNIYKFELKRNFKSWLAWFISLAVISIIMMLVFLMVEKINVNDLLEQMGMTVVFGLGMDYSIGYFSTEVIIFLQLAGAIYAAMLSIKMLLGEEKEKTAEFLLANPIDRKKIWTSKLFALLSYITFLVAALAIVNFIMILALNGSGSVQNTAGDYAGFWLTFFMIYVMLVAIGCCCYFLSAVLSRRSGTGLAIGISLGTYIISIIYKIAADSIKNNTLKGFFRIVQYISPFTFCDANITVGYLGHQSITSAKEFWLTMIGAFVWIALAVAALIFSRKKYYKKDIL